MTRWTSRRTLGAILLIVGAAILQGCVYDPYTGTYVPCCAAYPAYGGYAYPAYGSYGYPPYRGYYGAPPAGAYPGSSYQGPSYQGQGYQGQGYQGGRYQGPPPPP
jgi:hypothetical protein